MLVNSIGIKVGFQFLCTKPEWDLYLKLALNNRVDHDSFNNIMLSITYFKLAVINWNLTHADSKLNGHDKLELYDCP